MQIDPLQYILSLRELYGSYHHQKEQMAFAGTGLYLAGTSAIILQRDLPSTLLSIGWLAYALLGLFAAIAFIFVGWQLHLRERATRMVIACTNLANGWLTVPPSPKRDFPPEAKGEHWPKAPKPYEHYPKAILAEVRRVENHRKSIWGSRKTEPLIYITMAVWTLLVIIKLATSTTEPPAANKRKHDAPSVDKNYCRRSIVFAARWFAPSAAKE